MLRSIVFACLLAGGVVAAAEPFPLRDGDVVAFVGNTFTEREQRDGFIELALTLASPDADVTFRNLGWSGDTVTGRARRYFGTTDEGFQHLLTHLDLVKPTVIVVCYGTNEAFAGEAGRAVFLDGYAALLEELAKRTDRIVLVSAPPLDPSASPAPKIAERVNHELQYQSDAVRDLAAKRGFAFADLFGQFKPLLDADLPQPLTDNGLHYTPYGYRAAGQLLLRDLERSSPREAGIDVADLSKPLDPPYELLRQAIVAKNELFFHRHRPQNETYLRGFRKHEQGNNATEIFAFEPLVAEKDREIFELREALPER
ncbi:MAG: GDSL-type esterase/lipase family protein [Planctomycetaceae bacterium]